MLYIGISLCVAFFFFKQKTAYEMRISDWSSDVCSSDLALRNLDRAIAISRKPGHAQLLAAQLFNRGMILHDAGRDTEARLQLRESLRLREAMPGDHQGLLGDTLRLLGETSIGLGDHATAER